MIKHVKYGSILNTRLTRGDAETTWNRLSEVWAREGNNGLDRKVNRNLQSLEGFLTIWEPTNLLINWLNKVTDICLQNEDSHTVYLITSPDEHRGV